MADLGGEFDSSTITNTFTPAPAGDYELMVVESEMKPTKAGDGKYLMCKITILAGPEKGRSILKNFNWVNKSEKAVQIGKGEFSDLCKAVNVPKPRDSQQIHNLPFIGKVTVEGEYNDVKNFRPRAVGGVPAPTQPAAQAPPPVTAGSVPWGK